MGLIIKQKEIAKGINADVYVKIDSVRAGMGENGKITCSCGEWIGVDSRAAGEAGFKHNMAYHIPDENITIKNGTLIQAVYPAFKKYFENLGYTVLDDTNNYEVTIKQNAETNKEQADAK